MGGKRHAPAALPPGKARYPLYRRLGGSKAGRDRCGKRNFLFLGNCGSDCGGGTVVYLTTLFITNIIYLGWLINESAWNTTGIILTGRDRSTRREILCSAASTIRNCSGLAWERTRELTLTVWAKIWPRNSLWNYLHCFLFVSNVVYAY
jgi:hypothetical protein